MCHKKAEWEYVGLENVFFIDSSLRRDFEPYTGVYGVICVELNAWILCISSGQSIYLLGKVPIEILPEKRHTTWVSALLHFKVEFKMVSWLQMLFHMILDQLGARGSIWNSSAKSNKAKTHVMRYFPGRISIGTFPIEDMLWCMCLSARQRTMDRRAVRSIIGSVKSWTAMKSAELFPGQKNQILKIEWVLLLDFSAFWNSQVVIVCSRIINRRFYSMQGILQPTIITWPFEKIKVVAAKSWKQFIFQKLILLAGQSCEE